MQGVCGRLLVVPRYKKSRWSYQCTEFAADLHSVFGIDTMMLSTIHPLKFCYRCKQVMDRSILAQCIIGEMEELGKEALKFPMNCGIAPD